MPLLIRAGAGALLLASLAGCATTNMGTPGDPLERMNRGTHGFNDAIDRNVLKPVATAYRDHLPDPIQNGIDNVLEHLAFPTTIVNDLLQLKIKDTLVDLGVTVELMDAQPGLPDLVFTANVFALMGLRQLYFLIGGLVDRLVYLSFGLAAILGFIGIKLILHALHENNLPFINGGEPIHAVPDIGIALSLTFIVGVLAITTIASLVKAHRGVRKERAKREVETR